MAATICICISPYRDAVGSDAIVMLYQYEYRDTLGSDAVY